MRNTFIFLVFYCYTTVAYLQNFNISSKGSNECIPSLNQEQINSLVPQNGQVVFNLYTGNINYWFNGNWYEIKGNCTPLPHLPRIDSIFQENNSLVIHGNDDGNDSLHIEILNKIYYIDSLPYVQKLNHFDNSLSLKIISKTSCGKVDTVYTIPWESTNSEIKSMSVDNYQFEARKIGNVWWMCEDLKSENKKLKHPKGIDYYTYSDKLCPSGWEIPTVNEWNNLLTVYNNEYSLIFDKPNSKNLSIGLNKTGIYSKKELVIEKKSAYYWTSDQKGNKQSFFVISENGTMVLNETPSIVFIPVRCIKHE